MARLVPNPQALLEQLHRLLPHPAPASTDAPGAGAEERILDAALAAFTTGGVRATTMSQIARDAGISREWLYRHFRNRNAVAVAVTRREVLRFLDGLVVRAFQSDDVTAAVTDTFVYAVEFLRDHALLQRVLTSETDALGPHLVHDAQPIVEAAVQTAAGYLSAIAGLEPDRATIVAETLVRLAGSTALAPRAVLDLHDPEGLRRYAEAVVPAVLAIEPVAPAEPARRGTRRAR